LHVHAGGADDFCYGEHIMAHMPPGAVADWWKT
jgi:hypothetical protein